MGGSRVNLICISCPRGCHLSVEKENDGYVVSGNSCKRGEIYAINEMTNPLRTLTTTVPINSRKASRLPVMTSMPIPKGRQVEVMKYLGGINVDAPVHMGDVIVENVLDLNSDIIASKTILE